MSKAITEFLAAYSPEVQDLAWKTRTLVLEMVPGAIEQLDPSAKIIGYGFGRKMADIICVIMPYTSHVNLGFSRGAQLPDPKGLLEGTGKSARHVKIRTAADLEKPAVRALLKSAVAVTKRAAGKR
jgi:hypothetical protein